MASSRRRESARDYFSIGDLSRTLNLQPAYVRVLLIGAGLCQWVGSGESSRCIATPQAVANGLAVRPGMRRPGGKRHKNALTAAGMARLMDHIGQSKATLDPDATPSPTMQRKPRPPGIAATAASKIEVVLNGLPQSITAVSMRTLRRLACAEVCTATFKYARQRIDLAALGWRHEGRSLRRIAVSPDMPSARLVVDFATNAPA